VFWMLAAAFVVGNFTTNTVTVHLIPFLADRGYSPALAAAMIGWLGAMQVPARIVFVPIATRFGHRAVTATIFFAQAAGVIQLALASRLPTLVPMVVILGAANGMATLARATLVADIFGPRHYGSISGAIALGANGARALAPVGASLLQVGLGGYERLFWLLAVVLVVAGIGVAAIQAESRR
jgi:MFS family permease